MSDSGVAETMGDESIRKEVPGVAKRTEVLNRENVAGGLGTQTEANAETGEETGETSGLSAVICFEGGGKGVVKGDSEVEGAAVRSKGEDGSGETTVSGVWKEEERCPGRLGGSHPWLRWGGMRFS
eukprot:308829_1